MTFDLASRRDAMAALAGTALLILPTARALAQTDTSGGAAPKVGAAGPTGATIGQSQWRTLTLMAGTYAKMTGMVAQSKGTHPGVRQFGKFEADEQTVVAQTLTDKSNPPPAPLDARHQAKLAQLQAVAAGKAFDVAFVASQIEGHHELEQIQQSFLNAVPNDGNAKHIAMLARWSIQQHLVMLSELQTMLAAA